MKTVILDDWEGCMKEHPAVSRLREFSEVSVYGDVPAFETLVSRLQGADAIIPLRERTLIDRDLIAALPDLKLIAQTGTGLAHMDKDAVDEAGISVATTPGGSTAAVTEMTFAFLLNLTKRIVEVDRRMSAGEWPAIVTSNLSGKTIGLIGLGKIGCAVARMAQAFGMRVIAWGPRLTRERAAQVGVEYVSLESLLTQADAVSIHVRLVPETEGLLTTEHFELMKPDAILVNTSRGPIIDEAALIDALQRKKIGGAGLDVFCEEPLPQHNAFAALDNVMITPHMAWKTEETFSRFLNGSIDNIHAFFVKGEPQNIVSISRDKKKTGV
ncbi:D-3-phosphoglycerate dehydrogenase [Halomonas citrativorans]|uniref:D-3-phosphoglycerate dehydrogenase n=1 Tax=Halomonas citrativorans TaxID=2742612 RepID=A0A1R4I330_9GAMM|nr:D-2-hydroxyacid dehydrogenase family protein [Halomonas citrativorans]SJN14220.1 D-3-phosphoglycerate dehydrogenase [Halomonas citrativorans]